VGTNPNDAALLTFLGYGVLDHSDQTMFAGVRQISPGHIMDVGPAGAAAATRYWDLRVNPAPAGLPDEYETHASLLLALLRDFWRIVSAELWLREFFDARDASAGKEH
jgi:asparagine synthetase B (glutamine-hydrolysing)